MTNSYTYASNNPVRYTDPYGLMTVDARSCSEKPFDLALINLAVYNIEALINSNNKCIKGQDLRLLLKIAFDSANLICVPSAPYCGESGNPIKLGDWSVFENMCGPIEGVLLHELVHNTGNPDELQPCACQFSCFGFKGGNCPANEPCDCQ